jgi:4-hydroxybenzoate polyprenyltransferase
MRGWYFVFFSIGMVMVIASLFWLSMEILITCIVLSIFTFTYSWPLLPGKRRLREYGWLKILVLAGVWTIVTSILPLLYSSRHIIDYPFEILLRFVFIFTLCLIFDIRDMQTDSESHIDTLPNKVGIKNSYRLINSTLVLFLLLSVIQYFRYPVNGRLIGAVVSAIATILVVGYLKKQPSVKAYLGLADGIMMLYALLILLL